MVSVILNNLTETDLGLYSPHELEEWDAKTRALYEYWVSIRPAEIGLPGRQHFDPVDVPLLLPNIWLIDVLTSPLRFKFRLFGTAHYDPMRGEHTGKFIDEAYPDFINSSTYAHYVNLAEKAEISHRRGPATFHIPDHKNLERVMLPLARNGKDVDMILALTVYL